MLHAPAESVGRSTVQALGRAASHWSDAFEAWQIATGAGPQAPVAVNVAMSSGGAVPGKTTSTVDGLREQLAPAHATGPPSKAHVVVATSVAVARHEGREFCRIIPSKGGPATWNTQRYHAAMTEPVTESRAC
jgi:hypothetical protein